MSLLAVSGEILDLLAFALAGIAIRVFAMLWHRVHLAGSRFSEGVPSPQRQRLSSSL